MYKKRKERDEEAKEEGAGTMTDPVPSKETAPSKKPRGSVREEGDDMLLLLAKTRVEELAPTQKVLSVVKEETLPEAFKLLVEHNILAAPVLGKARHFLGFVDMLDFAQFIITEFGDKSIQSMEDVQGLMRNLDKWNSAKVSDIMRSSRGKAEVVAKGYSLLHAAEILAWSGAHRCPVADSSGHICHIVTQSMLIDFVWHHIDALGEKRHTRVDQLRLSPGTVVSVDANVRTLSALSVMIEKGVTGLPVVNEEGAVVDNISTRDLRGIKYDAKMLWRLWESVAFFKRRIVEGDQKAPTDVVYVLNSDTLETVVQKMADHHIHRVFVVDDELHKRPVRVLSQCDILQNVLRT